jgi:hypothetical protein
VIIAFNNLKSGVHMLKSSDDAQSSDLIRDGLSSRRDRLGHTCPGRSDEAR